MRFKYIFHVSTSFWSSGPSCPRSGCRFFQRKDALLQPLQEAAGVRAVHLGVVDLEEKRQRRPEKPPAAPAPDEKGIVENAAVHADRAVKLGIHDGGGVDENCRGRDRGIEAYLSNGMGAALQ